MRLVLIISIFLLTNQLHSQSYFLQDGSLAYDSSTTSLINMGGQRVDQSNAISRDMIGNLAFGGHISDGEKDLVRDRLNGQNYYGGDLSTSLTYTLFRHQKDHGWSLSYQYKNLNSLAFSDDLFTVFFYGNNEFLENPAILGENSLKIHSYQSLSLGWVNRKSGSNIRLGIYDNRSFSEIDITEAKLTTELNSSGEHNFAEEITLQAGSYSSRQATGQMLFSSGVGFGFSGEYAFQIDGSKFILGVEDLGAMYVNNLEESDTSGVFEYRGFNWEIGSGSPLNDVFNSLEDSLSPSVREASSWVLLPALFNVSYISPDFGRFYVRADANYRIKIGFRPELGIALNYRFNKDNSFWVRPNVGGFSDFSVGLGTQVNVFEKTLMRVGSNHLFGLVSGQGRASSIFIQIIQRI